MPPQPLPVAPDSIQGFQPALDAYARLLPLEDQHSIAIRLCGWMLILAPSAGGREYVAECINRCEDDQQIIAVGNQYIDYFVAYFRATLNKPTPPPSSHPSRPSLDLLRDQIAASRVETPKNHKNAKSQALIRDNYRCMLSRHVDETYCSSNVELHSIPGIHPVPTQCSHILPQYLGQGLGDPYRLDASANVWTVLQCFGGIDPMELNGALMHHLSNIMTLAIQYHTSFDSLRIWLTPIPGTENQYVLGRRLPGSYPELPENVTFTTTHPDLPLPDRRYLALHAACAQVIHLSGAARVIDKILDDAEEIKVLSEDGSSGELLSRLLSAEVLLVH